MGGERSLRKWNDDIPKIMKDETEAFKIYNCKRTTQSDRVYKQKRVTAKLK
jgi:hypothetical protein